MDRFEFLYGLDKVARAMRGIGLARVTRLGRDILGSVFRRGLEVEVDGFHVAGSLLHRGYLTALRDGCKEAFMTRLFEDAVRPGLTVLDIGAYLGWYMLVAARKVGPTGQVYAFEADPRNYVFVQRNIETNHLLARVVPVQSAVTRETGRMNLFLHDSDSSNTSLFYESPKAAITTVNTVSLDEYLPPETNVDVIKMDIEGGELRALEGMDAVLNRSAMVTMFVECHPKALRAAGGSSEELIWKLESLGFALQWIDEESRSLRPVTDEVHAVKSINLHCQKSPA